jgi:hypothetical protein
VAVPKPLIFISYRRNDAAGTAGRIGDWLEREYGRRWVFRDISIEPGEDFRRVIESKLNQCNILLAVMARSWADQGNLKRLGNPKNDDFVRIEIVSALDRGIPVLPVLIDGTPVPPKAKLPVKLQPVVALQVVNLRNLHFATDFKELVEAIEAAVEVPPGRLGPDGMRYREIPAGTFHFGAVPGDTNADDDEKPRHRVTISRRRLEAERQETAVVSAAGRELAHERLRSRPHGRQRVGVDGRLVRSGRLQASGRRGALRGSDRAYNVAVRSTGCARRLVGRQACSPADIQPPWARTGDE